MITPAAWLVWLVTAVVALSATRNPIYLVLILACIAIVAWRLRAIADAPTLPLSFVRLALVIIVTSALFNLITAHFGQTVLFRLPAGIPLLGGPYTLEALVYGVINGLVLAGFLGAFSVLILAVPTHALIRLIPRAFYPIAVVISIAIAFVPATLSQFQQIREAQLVRGHRVRGLRDWLPLFMPLFVGGLERAFQLAEAMTARGFGTLGANSSARDDRLPPRVRDLPPLHPGAGADCAAGRAAVAPHVGASWPGHGRHRARRRPGRSCFVVARTHDQAHGLSNPAVDRPRLAVVAGAAATAAGVLVLPRISSASLGYSPYPKLSVPPFDPLIALALLGLAVPAVVLWQASRVQQKSGLSS